MRFYETPVDLEVFGYHPVANKFAPIHDWLAIRAYG